MKNFSLNFSSPYRDLFRIYTLIGTQLRVDVDQDFIQEGGRGWQATPVIGVILTDTTHFQDLNKNFAINN